MSVSVRCRVSIVDEHRRRHGEKRENQADKKKMLPALPQLTLKLRLQMLAIISLCGKSYSRKKEELMENHIDERFCFFRDRAPNLRRFCSLH